MLTFCLILPPPLGGLIMFYSFLHHQHQPEGLKHPHGMTGRLELGYQSLLGLPGVESVCVCVCVCVCVHAHARGVREACVHVCVHVCVCVHMSLCRELGGKVTRDESWNVSCSQIRKGIICNTLKFTDNSPHENLFSDIMCLAIGSHPLPISCPQTF